MLLLNLLCDHKIDLIPVDLILGLKICVEIIPAEHILVEYSCFYTKKSADGDHASNNKRVQFRFIPAEDWSKCHLSMKAMLQG